MRSHADRHRERLLYAATWLAAAAGLTAPGLAGCGDEPTVEQRLDEIEEEIREAEPNRRPLDRRLRCRDRFTGDPDRIRDCIERDR